MSLLWRKAKGGTLEAAFGGAAAQEAASAPQLRRGAEQAVAATHPEEVLISAGAGTDAQSAIATPLNTRLKTGERNLVSAISGLALDGPSERLLAEKIGVELGQISKLTAELCAKHTASLVKQAETMAKFMRAGSKQLVSRDVARAEATLRVERARSAGRHQVTTQLRKQGDELRQSFSERLAKAEAAERQCAELQAMVAGGWAGGAGLVELQARQAAEVQAAEAKHGAALRALESRLHGEAEEAEERAEREAARLQEKLQSVERSCSSYREQLKVATSAAASGASTPRLAAALPAAKAAGLLTAAAAQAAQAAAEARAREAEAKAAILSSELAAQIESSRAAAERADTAEALLEAAAVARAALEAELLKSSRLSQSEAAAAAEEQKARSTPEGGAAMAVEAARLAEENASLRDLAQQQAAEIDALHAEGELGGAGPGAGAGAGLSPRGAGAGGELAQQQSLWLSNLVDQQAGEIERLGTLLGEASLQEEQRGGTNPNPEPNPNSNPKPNPNLTPTPTPNPSPVA